MKNSPYYRQAELMLRMLSIISQEKCFALKGGTAINFFLRDMPRLSVDIDLTYIPLEPREQSLKGIRTSLERVAKAARKAMPGLRFDSSTEYKLVARYNDAQIKIEPNTILRGTVFPPEEKLLCRQAQDMFEMFVSVNMVSLADLYGGKLCAALDRQHPRDLFDIMLLLENEGFTKEIRTAFVVYLASHDRPMYELLDPKVKDISKIFEAEFAGMTTEPVSLSALTDIQKRLGKMIRSSLNEQEKEFLLSFKKGEPKWGILGIQELASFPALQWKLINIQKLDKRKHQELIKKLEAVFEN